MKESEYKRIDNIDNDPYGIAYNFTLDESVDDVPEYLSPLRCITDLCKEYDLKVERKENFQVSRGERVCCAGLHPKKYQIQGIQ